MTEVAWFSKPPEATLRWTTRPPGDPHDLGHLHFVDPLGRRASVPVTTGPTRTLGPEMPIWHIDIADGVATVSPSIHYVGQWHSPNPVKFILVEEK